jgi:hypothetical protein
MKTYKVTYSGNSRRYKNFSREVDANSKREAVEIVYERCFEPEYYPQEDGSILDWNGKTIAKAGDDAIEYDGGWFSAEEIEIR